MYNAGGEKEKGNSEEEEKKTDEEEDEERISSAHFPFEMVMASAAASIACEQEGASDRAQYNERTTRCSTDESVG